MSRLLFAFSIPSALAVAACSQVLGVDWDSAHPESGGASSVSSSNSVTSSSVTSTTTSSSSISSSSTAGSGGAGGSCPVAKCAGGCVDTQSDEANCGYCGHVCTGCAAGLCPVVTVTNDNDFVSPRYLAISNDDKQLWILDDANQADVSGVLFEMTINPLDTASIDSVWTNFDVPTGLALDDSYAYVVGRGFVNNNAGGFLYLFNRSSKSYATNSYGASIFDAISFASTLYVTTLGNVTINGGGNVASSHPRFLRSNVSSLFWIEDDPTTPSVRRLVRDDSPKTNAPVIELETGFVDPRGLAAGPDRLFVALPELAMGMGGPQVGRIIAVPIDPGDAGPSSTVVASNVLQPQDLTADSEAFYFTDAATLGVYRCPIAGCPNGEAVKLADAISPTCIAVDSTSVYFCDQGDSKHHPAIYRVPR